MKFNLSYQTNKNLAVIISSYLMQNCHIGQSHNNCYEGALYKFAFTEYLIEPEKICLII